MGAERRSMVMPEEERRNTAYHESGHAIVARAAAEDRPGAQGHDHPARPRARRDDAAAGRGPLQPWTAISMLQHDRGAVRRPHRRRAVHEPDDHRRLERLRARHRARARHGHAWGMSDELGPMVYGENEGEVFLGRSVTTHKNVSEATMQKVDAEIRRIIDQQYARRAQAARGEPRQGRGDGQGAARVGDDRRRPDRRHHGRQAAASAEAAPALAATPSKPPAERRRRRRARPRLRPTA